MNQTKGLQLAKRTESLIKMSKKFGIAVWIFMLMILFIPSSNVYAAKKLTKAQKKTYKKCLENYITRTDWPDWWTSYVSNTKGDTEFALADVNGDGRKELLIYSLAGASWQWRAAYKSNGKPFKLKYYYDGKLCTESTKSNEHSNAYTKITKISNKAFLDEYYGHGGLHIKTYYKKKGSYAIEVAKYLEGYRGDEFLREYYVNGKRTTKEEYMKKVSKLGKFKSVKYYNYEDANKYLK